jgi:hypothetical protein
VDAAEDEMLHQVIDGLARKEEIALKMEQTTTMQVGAPGPRAGPGQAGQGLGCIVPREEEGGGMRRGRCQRAGPGGLGAAGL